MKQLILFKNIDDANKWLKTKGKGRITTIVDFKLQHCMSGEYESFDILIMYDELEFPKFKGVFK